MILTCPSCSTRFQVDETALQHPDGRPVRCGNCGHRWHHGGEAEAPLRAEREPPTVPIMPGPEAPTTAARPEPPLPSTERHPVLATSPESRRRSHAAPAVAAVLVLVVVAAALAAGIVERRAIVARYPAAAGFYARLGLPVETEQAGKVRLKIEHVVASLAHNRLIIEGDVQNPGSTTSKIPKLRITLKDRQDREVQSQIIDAPEPQVAAGAHVHFSAPFEKPNASATDVEVTFLSGSANPGTPWGEPSPEPSATPSAKPARS